jgi:hypothetical protein
MEKEEAGRDLTPDERVLRVAADQRMLVSRRQVRDAGLSARQIKRRVTTGGWLRVHRDVFAVDGRAPRTWRARVMAAVLVVPDGVASHRTALYLHGVRCLRKTGVIEVSAPRGCATALEGVRVRSRRHLPAGDRTVVDGIPCTTAERAIVDVAGELEHRTRLAVLEEALYSTSADRRRFVRRARACSRGRPGVRALAEVADDRGAARFRSWLEAEASQRWQEAGLPEPRWNVDVHDRAGRIGEIDAVFPGGVVVVELDGMKFHSSPAQRREDKGRDRRLALSGRVVLRFDWKDVVERPRLVIDQIREALEVTAGRPAIPLQPLPSGGRSPSSR